MMGLEKCGKQDVHEGNTSRPAGKTNLQEE